MGFTTDSPDRIYGATDGQPVTPSDSTDLAIKFSRGVLVGTSGSLNVVLVSGTVIQFPTLAAGVIHPICASRILATGTTATNIIAVK
jgi:hypothetical protein